MDNKNMKKIYPEISIIVNDSKEERQFTCETYLRIKHTDGKWYLRVIRKSFTVMSDNPLIRESDTIQFVGKFHKEVYYTIICGVVSLNMFFNEGEKLFELDENQQEETERQKHAYFNF